MHPITTALVADMSWIQPELALAAFALIATLIGAWFGDRAAGFLAGVGTLVFILVGVAALMFRPAEPVVVFNGSLQIDGFSALVKAIIAFSAAATLWLGAAYFARLKERRFEFTIITTLAVLGMFIMASANDLIALYIGVELQSLAAYVLAAWRRDDAKSSEAGLKYFVLGALSSGLLLYGASLVYGFAGSIRFEAIAQAPPSPGLIFGLVFMLCGLAFKLSAAPFHMWTPDVYEGAPSAVTALFAAAPKMAAVALFARVLYEPFAGFEDQWRQVVIALAVISLLWGSFAALVQTSIKRLMAYSSIANIGFVLMALAAGPERGASAALIYMALYLPATIGVFAVITAMRRDGVELEQVDDLAGLAQHRPWMAYLLTLLFFSLSGIPPLAGFFGKIAVFNAAIQEGLWPLALVGAVATVVGAGYYLRVLARVWFAPPAATFDRSAPAVTATAGLAGVLTFPVLALAFGPLQSLSEAAARSSFLAP
jgi:NADH-quinone oxidoreductase subunit N